MTSTTLEAYITDLAVRGELLSDVPQPYGASVAHYYRTRGGSIPALELIAFLLRDLDAARDRRRPCAVR